MVRSLFVAGTDTGVGKTLTTALLALKLREKGIDAGVMKPFATGCEIDPDGLVAEDAVFLKAATGVSDSLDLINPIRLKEPLAPLVAARRAGVDTRGWKDQIRDAYADLLRRHECVLVEGVGGLMVPVGEDAGQVWNCLDLIEAWQLPVVLVARRRLGTINHVLLTTRVQLSTGFAGLIFCDAEPVSSGDIAAQSSPAVLAELTGLPIWGQIRHLKKIDAGNLREISASIDLAIPD